LAVQQVAEAVRLHRGLGRTAGWDAALELLRLIDQDGRPSVKLACSIHGAALMVTGESDPSYARIISDLGTSTVTLVNRDGRQRLITP
jgi:hypothetical protein